MLHVISTFIVAVKQETFAMNWIFFFLGLEFEFIVSQVLVFFLHFYFFCLLQFVLAIQFFLN